MKRKYPPTRLVERMEQEAMKRLPAHHRRHCVNLFMVPCCMTFAHIAAAKGVTEHQVEDAIRCALRRFCGRKPLRFSCKGGHGCQS